MVKAVRYHDPGGKLLREDNAVHTLPPLASAEVFVEFKDDVGGACAKLIVVWRSDSPVNPPIIESVNTHFIGAQPTSFTSREGNLSNNDSPLAGAIHAAQWKWCAFVVLPSVAELEFLRLGRKTGRGRMSATNLFAGIDNYTLPLLTHTRQMPA